MHLAEFTKVPAWIAIDCNSSKVDINACQVLVHAQGQLTIA